VFVLHRYEGLEPILLQEMTREERDRYVALNAGALAAHLPADLVFANHVLMGAPVAAAAGASFAVKAHGSELEYSMRGNQALEAWGARSLRGADAVFVGSAHIRAVLEEVVGHVDRVYEVPPGVDVDEFVPRTRAEALAALLEECRADPPNPANRQERLADVAVVPSIFPEAFGMVAAEAAAAGCPPLVARHSGLEEIAQGLEAAYPADRRHLASFETGNSLDLADKLHELLALPARRRAELGEAARR